MSDYSFSELNDKEFEVLCADLIGDERGHRFERFKSGRDSGVDGRYFSPGGKEIVLQCKHWPGTPVEKLFANLERIEREKVAKLKPISYILAISNPLSRREKKDLRAIFSPYIKREDDIYGREDLNDLLSTRPLVLRRHTKLWLNSAEVLSLILNSAILGRSKYALEEMISAARSYVRTSGHEAAIKIAEDNGIVIIAGEPGIGKTTLAEQLCLEYVASGFTLLKIADDVSEAEAVFRSDERQIFYFDDFLGRNYLDAFRGTSGSHIVQFMKRVAKAKANKRFILTSRSTILNRGKFALDSYRHENMEKREHVLTINSLTQMDRAQILYNHIWFSTLPSDYAEEIYKDKRYRKIIDHDNFNPRLIQFITDHDRLKDCSPAQYWEKIEQSLNNPSEVWENPFLWQQESNGRVLVLLVVMQGRPIQDERLGIAFARFVSSPAAQHIVGGQDFLGTLKQLVGSFLSRTIKDNAPSLIDLFNPSIGDYVLRRYAADTSAIFLAISSLRSIHALQTLRSQLSEEIISKQSYDALAGDLLAHMCTEEFKGFGGLYMAEVVAINISLGKADKKRQEMLRSAIQAMALEEPPSNCTTFAKVFGWALKRDIITEDTAINFVLAASTEGRDDDELRSLANLLMRTNSRVHKWDDAKEALQKCIIIWMSDNVSDIVKEDDVLEGVGYAEYMEAERVVEEAVAEKLKEFNGLIFTDFDIESALDAYDVREALDELYENGVDYERRFSSSGGNVLGAFDDVDDLFDRR